MKNIVLLFAVKNNPTNNLVDNEMQLREVVRFFSDIQHDVQFREQRPA